MREVFRTQPQRSERNEVGYIAASQGLLHVRRFQLQKPLLQRTASPAAESEGALPHR